MKTGAKFKKMVREALDLQKKTNRKKSSSHSPMSANVMLVADHLEA